MSFLDEVIDRTRQIEGLLEDNLGATGRGLHEKATTVESQLGAVLVKRIRYIATIRNKLVHEADFDFDGDEAGFLDLCDQVIATLRGTRRAPAGTSPPRPTAARPIPQPIPRNVPPASPTPRRPAEPFEYYGSPAPRKPWYRSTWFLLFSFFFLPPVWALLMLTDRNQGCLVKLVALGFLAGTLCLLYGVYFLIASSGGGIDPNTPSLLPAATQGQPPNLLAPAAETERPGAAPGCEVAWEAYPGADLSGKNRAMVWMEIVRARVAGSDMTPQQFYRSVIEHNPELEADGFVFKEGMDYDLPVCK